MSFEKNAENLAAAKSLSKDANKLHISTDSLSNSSNASFSFEDGDKVTIPAQLAHIVKLSSDMIESAKKRSANPDKVAEGYWAFYADVTRGEKSIRGVRISARQLYTPTVWLEADEIDLSTFTDGAGNEVKDAFTAPFNEGVKRFGEHGGLQLLEGTPFIPEDIVVDMKSETAFINYYVPMSEEERNENLDSGYTVLRKREDYAIAE